MTDTEALLRVPRSVRLQAVRRVGRLRGRLPDDDRADPGDRAHRQRARHPAVDHRPGPQQHLRRRRAARARVGHREHARDEPGPRGQRGPLLRGRASPACAGSTCTTPSRRPAALLAVDPRPRLGQRRRQHPGVRARLHALRRPRDERLRHGGRAPRRRGPAHRHGRPDAATRRGTSTSTPTARRSTACSCRATSGSSPRWASGSCRAPRSTRPAARRGRARRPWRRWSTRCARSCSRGSSATTPSWAAGSASAWTPSRSSTRPIRRGGCASRSTGASRSSTRTGTSRGRRSRRSRASRSTCHQMPRHRAPRAGPRPRRAGPVRHPGDGPHGPLQDALRRGDRAPGLLPGRPAHRQGRRGDVQARPRALRPPRLGVPRRAAACRRATSST